MHFGMRETLFVAVLLAIPLASYFFVFAPTNEQISLARQEIEKKKSRLGELQAATQQIQNLDEEIRRLTEAIGLFEAKLPAEKEVDVVLQQVWELARKHDLRPRTVKTKPLVKNTRYHEMPISMSISGNFDGFYRFLLDLERFSRITRIPEMKIKKLKDGEGLMQADFTLSIFFEPPNLAKDDPVKPKA